MNTKTQETKYNADAKNMIALLQSSSADLAKFIVETELSPEQENDLRTSIGGLTAQILALHASMAGNELNDEQKTELLTCANNSVTRTRDFLSSLV